MVPKMFLTNVLLKKAKAKQIMVLLRSTGSNHTCTSFRDRIGDKKELITFDPLIQKHCVYKEEKKIRSMKRPINIKEDVLERTYGIASTDYEKLFGSSKVKIK